MNTLQIEPNTRLKRIAGVDAELLTATKSRFLITERIRLDTTPIVSVYCTTDVLSNVWWTALYTGKSKHNEEMEIAANLWINSTPGLLLLIAELQVTEGAWAGIKKATLQSLRILDFDLLKLAQLKSLKRFFDSICMKEAPRLPQQFKEAAEGRGWRHSLDTAVLSILTGEDVPAAALRPLYELLVEETGHW